jgi:hypothetical protein
MTLIAGKAFNAMLEALLYRVKHIDRIAQIHFVYLFEVLLRAKHLELFSASILVNFKLNLFMSFILGTFTALFGKSVIL